MRKIWTKMFLLLILAVAIVVPNSGVMKAQAQMVTEPYVLATDEPAGEETGTGEGEGSGEGNEGAGEEGQEPETPPTVPETTFEGNEVALTLLFDSNLYGALLDLYKSTDPNYHGDTLYSDMFKDFTEINVDKCNISTLRGLEKFEFDSLETFSANSNEISEFDKEWFVNTEKDIFKSLSLAGNKIKGVDLSYCTGLRYLDLSSNELQRLDVSFIEGRSSSTQFELNVANNKIKGMKYILLPEKKIGHITLNIINNNIAEISNEYFTDKYTLKIGVQGAVSKATDTVTFDTKYNLRLYKTYIEGLGYIVNRIDGEEDVKVFELWDAQIENDYVPYELGVGEYEVIYTFDGVTSAYERHNHTRAFLKSMEFDIVPQKASYIFIHKGQEYKEIGKVTGAVTVKLSAEEGAKIFYQVDGGEWIEGNEVVCDQGGSYAINVKTMIAGVESEVETIWVRTSLNRYIPDILMLVLLVLLSLVLFLVVLPYVSRKYFKKD